MEVCIERNIGYNFQNKNKTQRRYRQVEKQTPDMNEISHSFSTKSIFI